MLFYAITLINWVINADFIIRHLFVFIFLSSVHVCLAYTFNINWTLIFGIITSHCIVLRM